MQKATNIYWHQGDITKSDRERLIGQKGMVLWFTGLSGSGKSTVCREVEKQLFTAGHLVYVLDGDNIRFGLNKNLGFSPEDRAENIRRIAEVSKLFADAGVITLTAFISPYDTDRRMARNLFEQGDFVEVFARCPVEVCEARDVKGLYKKARAGEIKEFTGISAPYEEPAGAELVLDTDKETVEQSAARVIKYLKNSGVIGNPQDYQLTGREWKAAGIQSGAGR